MAFPSSDFDIHGVTLILRILRPCAELMGRNASFLFEECTEMMRIVITAAIRYFSDFQVSGAQQFFGMIDSQIVQVISEGLPNLMLEYCAEVARTQVKSLCNLIHLQLCFTIVFICVCFGLLDEHGTQVVSLVVAENECAGNDRLQFRFYLLERINTL